LISAIGAEIRVDVAGVNDVEDEICEVCLENKHGRRNRPAD